MSTPPVSSAVQGTWDVLGIVRYSQYNTPYETNCSLGDSSGFIVTFNKLGGGKTTCTFTAATLRTKFVAKTKLNGTGKSINFGFVKPGNITTMKKTCPLPWPAGATLNNSFVEVVDVRGFCDKPLVPNTSVATIDGTCGDQPYLVNPDNVNFGYKTDQDTCPDCYKDFNGTQGHIDSYTNTQFCDAHKQNVDLGNFWTIR